MGSSEGAEVSLKVLKHLTGAFFYRFWTTAWPRIGKATSSDLSNVNDDRRQRLIADTTNAIEAFVNFGCIATGILQILALSCHKKQENLFAPLRETFWLWPSALEGFSGTFARCPLYPISGRQLKRKCICPPDNPLYQRSAQGGVNLD